MSPQRVLVFGNARLLDAGIANLLSRQADLEMVNIASDDTAILLGQIEMHRPDAIVLDELTYRADRTKLLAFLENYPEIRVILVSVDSNLISIYRGQQVTITHVTDFVNIVRGVQGRP